MEYTLLIIAMLAVPVISGVANLHFRRKLVQELVWAQLNGQGTKGYFVSFMDASPEQLLYPLTDGQLRTIRACRNFERTTAEIRGIRSLDGMLNDFYFTVHYDICGTLPSGETFSIREDAYLRVCFLRKRIIHWVVDSRKPF